MKRRVVVTGVGVVTPNAVGKDEFAGALRAGASGLRNVPEMAALNFGCTVAGVPQGFASRVEALLPPEELVAMNDAMQYAAFAALEAWKDAGLERRSDPDASTDWDSGCIVGTGINGMDVIVQKLIPAVSTGRVRRMGSTLVEQIMASGVSAKISGIFALGNQVTTNSSACNTGLEAIAAAADRIASGRAERMLAGGCEGSSPYIWAGFDAMRVLSAKYNDVPSKASRPMSATAGGFIPGSGAGLLVVESLESAQARGARIYAEMAGWSINCGGHRNGGSMTAPNPHGVQKCIRDAVMSSGIRAEEIDAINGHLTATMADPYEIGNWAAALKLTPAQMPRIQATKSLIGHCLGAAGSIESAAAILQLDGGFLHPSLNCEDIHPLIAEYESRIVRETTDEQIHTIAKASFGFGDVNSCVLFRKWKDGNE